MFVVVVRLRNCFPFADNELFVDPEDAVKKAYEWLEYGGAVDCEVMDEGTWLNRTAAATYTAIGLGKVFGIEAVTVTEKEAA